MDKVMSQLSSFLTVGPPSLTQPLRPPVKVRGKVYNSLYSTLSLGSTKIYKIKKNLILLIKKCCLDWSQLYNVYVLHEPTIVEGR